MRDGRSVSGLQTLSLARLAGDKCLRSRAKWHSTDLMLEFGGYRMQSAEKFVELRSITR